MLINQYGTKADLFIRKLNNFNNLTEAIWVIPRQITQGPTWPVSDVSEKSTKNTSMCSKDTNKILDANHY